MIPNPKKPKGKWVKKNSTFLTKLRKNYTAANKTFKNSPFGKRLFLHSRKKNSEIKK